jgi:hypothetical protein
MKYRLVTSLLLVAVLSALYLWLASTDTPPADPIPDRDTTPSLGRIQIF